MRKQLLAIAAGTALLGSGAAAAAPFSSYDPRSMAMGGAGVAVRNAGTAPLFNPALLSGTRAPDKVVTYLPILGARAYDPRDLYTGLTDFQNANLLGRLINATNDSDRATYANRLITDTKVGFPAISDKSVQGEIGAATIIALPRKNWGAAFVASGWASGGGTSHFSQEDQTALARIVSECAAGDFYCEIDALSFVSTSTVDARGMALAEVGISVARDFSIAGAPLAIGVTPKYVTATTFDYRAAAMDTHLDSLDLKDHSHEQRNFNLDLGVARSFRNGWRGGLVIKNLIPQRYDFKQRNAATLQMETTGSVALNPQARAGVAYDASWFTTALDVDLTENDPVGFDQKTRYVAIGTELCAADWAQLRLGYRVDTVNSDRNVASAGFGLSPLGLQMDLGLAANANEVGAAFQFGFRF